MGSEDTSKVEVKNSKSRKRTKKQKGSNDITTSRESADNLENDIDNLTELGEKAMIPVTTTSMKRGKRREKKKKLNVVKRSCKQVVLREATAAVAAMAAIQNSKESYSISMAGIMADGDKEDKSDDELLPPTKKRSTTMHADDDNDDGDGDGDGDGDEDDDDDDNDDGDNDDNSIDDNSFANKNNKSNRETPKQPSKRQLKRERAERREKEKWTAHKMDAMKKGLNYVCKWKHARSEWKFEKLRQIWLIDNLLDETSIPDDIFPTVLEYFEGCKGMAREQLLKKGMDIIKKIEENEDNGNENKQRDKEEQLESIAYQRARKLLQALPTET